MRQHVFLPPALRAVGWRYLWIHRWQSLLMVLGISLGVAVMVAIDIANASASRAFELSTEAVTGRATHQITGGPQGVDESLYRRLRVSGLVGLAAPLVTETVTSPQLGGQPLQLMGIDPFVDAPFRGYLGGQGGTALEPLTAFLTRPGAVLLAGSIAEKYGLKPGDGLQIEINGRQQPAFVAGLLDPQDGLARRTLEGVIVADIATAQELTGKIGWLDRIDLIVPKGGEGALKAIEAVLPEGTRVAAVAARQGSIEQMTAAFRLNLAMLSLLALVVGLFLIYNTMTFSVVQRRPLFGTLRCLGVTRREVFLMVIGEALAVGVLGAALGIGLGVLLGRNTVAMVTQTINDLYFTTTVRGAGVPLASLVKGGVLGVLATVFTAAMPALEAASVPPRAALSRSGLESKARRLVIWLAAGGAALILLGVGLFQIPGDTLIFGFAGTLLVVVGFAMLSALVMTAMMRLAGPLLGRAFGLLGRMAPRNLVNALSRTSVAVAALMVAVGVTVGVSLMIDSFRYTVTLWLAQTLQGDVYITAPSFTANQSTVPIDPQMVQKVVNWPGAATTDTLRTVQVEYSQGSFALNATSNTRVAIERLFLWTADPQEQVWQKMQDGAIIISEPLARRLNLMARGSQIILDTPAGKVTFPVEGVYYDYASSEGAAFITRDVYQRLWRDETVTAIGVRLPPGGDADAAAQSLRDLLQNDGQRLLIRPNEALRRDVMVVFDRTFAITAALRVLATVVAFIGILSTLLLLQLEKQREVGILRALGLSGRQLWRLTMLETGLMGLAAGILAAPTGYVLALILIYVINQRSFGWTLQLALSPQAFLQAVGLAVLAALLAGIYPALRLGSMPAAEAIRYE